MGQYEDQNISINNVTLRDSEGVNGAVSTRFLQYLRDAGVPTNARGVPLGLRHNPPHFDIAERTEILKEVSPLANPMGPLGSSEANGLRIEFLHSYFLNGATAQEGLHAWKKDLAAHTSTTTITERTTTMTNNSTMSAASVAFKRGLKAGAANAANKRLAQLVYMRFADSLPPWFGTEAGLNAVAGAIPLVLHFVLTEGPGAKLPHADAVREFCALGMEQAAANAAYELVNKLLEGLMSDGLWDAIVGTAKDVVGDTTETKMLNGHAEEDVLRGKAAHANGATISRNL